jgi:hypothetical protein
VHPHNSSEGARQHSVAQRRNTVTKKCLIMPRLPWRINRSPSRA